MKYLFLLLISIIVTITASAQLVEICNNGIDDDFDGFIDCYDGSCVNSPSCAGIFLGNDANCTSIPAQFPKFTMSLDFSSPDETTNHLARMVIGDLDRDGMPEIATMNRYTNTLFILNGNNGSIKYSKVVTFEPYWEVATANVDNDNCAEIFYIGYLPEISHTIKVAGKNVKVIDQEQGIYLFAYDCQLNFIWRAVHPFPNGFDPINFGVADFDSDGIVEIYAKDEVYDAKTGTRLIKSTAANYQTINGGPVAVNMLGDSKLELVIGLNIYQVTIPAGRIADSGSLTLLQGRNDYFIRYEYNATSIADYNLDGFLDVLASGSTIADGKNTTVFYWDVKNNVVKTYSDPQPGLGAAYTNGWQNGTGRLNVADLDGDGKMNVSFVSGGLLYALNENWGLFWKVNINEQTSGYTGCTLFDFNGDGKAEIVYRDERFLYIINGTDGTNYQNPQPCISRTNREYPIVADVDADGATEICVACGFDDVAAAANFNTLSYSRYSHIRVFKSGGAPWVPARRVWNQHGYFVVNVNDDLTIPKVVQAHQLVWSTGSCTQGPNRPLNKFLNQSPFLNSKGCPTYAAVDFSFSSIKPTITPPTCPNVNFTVSLQITNLGDATINGNVPISFYTSNPKRAGATKLNTINIALNNFAKNSTVNLTNQVLNGVGSDSLYVVLNDAGTSGPTPIVLPNAPIVECSYTDNIFGAGIHPIPVKLTALEVNKNDPCANPPNGAARAYVPIAGGGENTTDYNFYWFKGTVAKPIPSADYVGPIYSGIPDGTYMVYSRHKTAGCNSDTVKVVVGANPGVPAITVTVVSNQTVCNPQNGQLQALVAGGNAGFTFNWYDVSLTPLGISGPTASSLLAGNYIVIASRNGCSNKSPQATVSGPQVPDATAKVLLNVTDCSNPNSGSVQADALIGGVIQNPANYTFDWYFYNSATSTRGSILPAGNGAGQIRTGLAVGFYQAVIKDNATQCIAGQSPIVQVISQTVLPTASIAEISPQTSCDPAKQNGVLKGTGVAPGLTSPTDFTFEWFKGDNTLPANKVLTVSGAKGETLNKVSGGGIYYTVKVTTALNCTATAKYIISENVNVPVLTLTQLTPNSVCDATKATNPYNGSIKATVTFGGVAVTLPDPLYQFTWYNGPTVSDPVIAVADPKNPVLSGLKDANYTAIVQRTDLFCTAVPKTQTVVKATVLPVLSSSSTGSNNCNAALTPDGTVTVSVTNPVAGDVFGYQWYSGNAVIPANALGAANNGLTATAIKVGGPTGAPKPYTVLVSNKTTGCENNTTQFVADNSVIPVLSFASIVPNSICSPATSFNGSLTVQVNNIPALYTIADYTFKWYDGNSNAAPVDGTSTSTLLNKLDAGFYTVDGKNTKTGCQSAPITNQVPNAKIFPTLVPTATGSHNCSGPNADGTAIVTISNIQAGDVFTYQWHIGNAVGGAALGAGNNGTSATAIKVGGPVGAPNSYTVLVTNTTTGCTNFTTASVPDNSSVPILSLTPSDNSICLAALGYNGSINTSFVDTNGAADPHTYVWSIGNNMASPIAGQTAATLPGRNGGFYTATITNTFLGCTSSPVTTEIKNNQVLPAINAVPTPSTNCPGGADNGSIIASVTNGAAGQTFAFAWHKGNLLTDPAVPNGNGGNTATITGQQGAKNYIVLSTNNQTGCTNTFVQLLADNSSVPVLTLTPADNSICSAALGYNGSISSSFTDTNGAAGPHTYIWSTGNTMSSPIGGQTAATLPGQNGGFYTATITNTALGCTSSPVTTQILNNQVLPAISAVPTPSTNCPGGLDNGKVVGTVTNGAAGQTFAFAWHKGNLLTDPAVPPANGGNTATITGQQGAKNYIVLSTNNQTGCTNTFIQILADNSSVPVLTLTPADNSIC